jgi:LPPG:FO 2-phospho-L-lactate transferase
MPLPLPTRPAVVVLSGGVGGSKLVAGLARQLDPDDLLVVVNTGDDMEHLGLSVSPDLDTVLHRLAGVHDPARGWGRRDESWRVMDGVAALGGPDWFRLGDLDLATHLVRTHELRTGATLTEVTRRIAAGLGVAQAVVPMSDDPVRTRLRTDAGWQDFQTWFVRDRAKPAVHELAYVGADVAGADPRVVTALRDADLVVVAPSNPLLSIDPIRAVPALGRALVARTATGPTIAVSPLIGGSAVRGPAATLMRDLGHRPDARGVAAHLADVVTDVVLDDADRALAADVAALGLYAHVTDTLMDDADAEERLARDVLAAIDGRT